jgi:dTDP-4-amino-4,6-dideoxygalactose transaminase
MDLQVPFVDLRVQNETIKQELLDRFSGIIERSAFTLGDEVVEFEENFARFCNVRCGVGVGSGTDALVLALRALDVGPGDEVITVVNTFVATAEAIAHVGAKPVLVDIDLSSYNIDVTQIESQITERTRAIIPVHLYGQSASMDSIIALAQRYGLRVIEDAAQAQGAKYQGQPVGSLGDVGCFSFYPAKNLGAYGDAGAVITNRDDVALRVRELRDHGGSRKYEHRVVGYTSRLDALQAAVLNTKMAYLNQWNEMRQEIAHLYNELLSDESRVILPTSEEQSTHVFHLYVIRIESADRDALSSYLASKGIATGIHYPIPVHLTQAFQYLGYKEGTFPVAEQGASQILSLPIYPGLELRHVEYVAHEIKAFLRNTSAS